MIDVTNEEYWNSRFEKNKEHKTTFANKMIKIGLILFSICVLINTILIYSFFSLLNKI